MTNLLKALVAALLGVVRCQCLIAEALSTCHRTHSSLVSFICLLNTPPLGGIGCGDASVARHARSQSVHVRDCTQSRPTQICQLSVHLYVLLVAPRGVLTFASASPPGPPSSSSSSSLGSSASHHELGWSACLSRKSRLRARREHSVSV